MIQSKNPLLTIIGAAVAALLLGFTCSRRGWWGAGIFAVVAWLAWPNSAFAQAVTVSKTELMVHEGGSASYTVVLDTQPTNAVTITVAPSSGDDKNLTASPETLTFTNSDWSMPQTVTVLAAEDDDSEHGTALFTHTVVGPGTPYDGLTAPGVTATEIDNDPPGIMVSEERLLVPEGGSASYTVVLITQPTDDVKIEVTRVTGDEDLTASPDTLTFTNSNWSMPQTVTIHAAEDDDGAAGPGQFSHNVISPGTVYDGIPTPGVRVTEDDNDTIGVIISPTALSVPEGGSATYTVRLGTKPSNGVTVEATPDQRNDADLTVSSDTDTDTDMGIDIDSVTLAFTNSNWNTEQTVTVTAAEDADEVDGVAIFSHTTKSFDEFYDSLAGYPVTATEADNEKVVTVAIQTDLSAPVRGVFEVMIIFSEAVMDFDQSKIAVTNGSVTDFSGSGTTYKAWITPSKNGEVIVEVAANVVEYGVGNGNLAAEPLMIEADLDRPGVPIEGPTEPVELKVSFRQAEYEIGEGEQADIEVKVAPTADRRVEVPLVVAPKGGATDEDYSGVPTKVVFEEGASEGTISVEVLADEVNDPGEGVVLSFGVLPEAVSGGAISQTTVNFTQRRTAEQFSQTLEVSLAVLARSTAASAQTAIESRFERYRQWRRPGSSGGAMPAPQSGHDNSATALSPGASARNGSQRIDGTVRRGPSASDAAKTNAATASSGAPEGQARRIPRAWLRNVSLGSLGNLAGAGRSDPSISAGAGTAPGRRGDGQHRLYGSGVGDAPLGAASGRMRDLELSLSGVSFEMSLGEREQETSWVPVLWGQGDLQHFNGDLARLGMDYRGDLEAAHVGLDLYANERVLTGLSFMRSWGDLDYTDDDVDGELESDLHTVHPYLYWQPNERVSVWGIGGLGWGQVDVKEPGRTHDFDADFWMFAGGVRAVLTRRGNHEWGLRADAFTAQLETDALEDITTVSGEAHRGRLMLEWVHDLPLSVGRSLSLKAEAGGRFDGGDAERGAGLETGVRLGYLDANHGLDVALHGRVLVVHEKDYRDWGVGVQASWDPGEKQRGFRTSVTSSLGQDGGGQTTLWDNADAVMHPTGMGAMGLGAQYRMESEVAYGARNALGLPGLLTPYSRLRLIGQGRELALGTAWSLPARSQLAPPATLELEAIRRENRTGPAELGGLLRVSLPF